MKRLSHGSNTGQGNSGVTLGSWRPLGVSHAIIAKKSNNKITKKNVSQNY